MDNNDLELDDGIHQFRLRYRLLLAGVVAVLVALTIAKGPDFVLKWAGPPMLLVMLYCILTMTKIRLGFVLMWLFLVANYVDHVFFLPPPAK